MRAAKIFSAFFVVFLVSTARASDTESITYEIVRTIPHSTTHFTQGLVWRNGRLFESVGRYGESAVYELDANTGKVLKQHKMDDEFFGEGLTWLNDRLYQLSWRNRLGFIYNSHLEPQGFFSYPTEGWGLTDDGSRLIMSDGTDTLYWMDTEEFHIRRRLPVRYQDKPVTRLNELEYVKGSIWANVWLTPFVVKISPESGNVLGVLDLSELLTKLKKPDGWNEDENVLNGIAYDAQNDLFYVTGKEWPLIFVIRIKQK